MQQAQNETGRQASTADVLPRVTWTPLSVGRVIPLLVRHWLFVAMMVVLFLGLSLLVLVVKGGAYDVQSRILVKLGHEMTPPTQVSTETIVSTTKRLEDLNSEIAIMTDPRILEEVVDFFGEAYFLKQQPAVTTWQRFKRWCRDAVQELRDVYEQFKIQTGLSIPLTPREKLLSTLRKGLSVDVLPKSDVIEISLQIKDPDAGLAILRKYLELYQERHVQAFRSPGTRELFETQVDDVRKALESVEEARAKFKKDNGIVNLDEQRQVLLKRIAELKGKCNEADSLVIQVGATVEAFDRYAKELPETIFNSRDMRRNQLLDWIQQRLVEAESTLAKVRSKYPDENRYVIEAQSEVDRLMGLQADQKPFVTEMERIAFNEQGVKFRNELLVQQSQLEGLKANQKAAQEQLAETERPLPSLDAAELDFRRFDREIAVLRSRYELQSKKLEEARIADAMGEVKLSNITVIQPPWTSKLPVGPRLSVLLGLGAFAGLGLAVGLLLLLEAWQPLVRNRKEIQEVLGTHVLASVPNIR